MTEPVASRVRGVAEPLGVQPPKVTFREWREHLLYLLRPYRARLIIAHIAMVLDAAFTVARPWPLKVIMDKVIDHRSPRVPLIGAWLHHLDLDPMHLLYWCCAATLLFAVGTGISTSYYVRTMGSIGELFTFDLRNRLFAHMQRLSLRFHDKQRTGDLTTRLSADINAIDDLLTDSSYIVVQNGCLLIGTMGVMMWVSAPYAMVALAPAPLLFAAIVYLRFRIRTESRTARASDGIVTSIAQETLSSIRIVQGLVQEDQQDERFEAQGRVSLDARLRIKRLMSLNALVADLLVATGTALVLWYGVTRFLSGEVSSGDVVLFFNYSGNLYAPMRALARSSGKYLRAEIGAERVVEILRQDKEVKDLPGARPAPRFRGDVEFRNVSFAYEQGREVLSGIDLHVKAGEKIAIVGATGAGKSTLVSLVPRLYDPVSGSVHIDGEDLRHYTMKSVREHITLVLQESLLFKGTIRDNIAFGHPDATTEQIRAAAKTAHADEFIDKLPDGYETTVSERGTTLSGGQKQRIAIARAILRDSPILILDEPTTGLDAASERAVMNALETAARGRTTFIIAHRFGSVRFADRILVLDAGRIVEEGTHEELIARDGRYARLHQLQFQAKKHVEGPAH